MIYNVYSILDKQAKAYAQPFFLQNDDMAERTFSTTLNDPSTVCYRYPEHFVLCKLGTYDDNIGKIESLDTPEILFTGHQLHNKQLAMHHELKQRIDNIYLILEQQEMDVSTTE